MLPDELLTCRDLHYTQEYFSSQKDVANFILDLHSAYTDCKSKLEVIKELQK